jgi:catechol 2,3-dioxygenase
VHSGREPIDLNGLLAEMGPSPVLEPTLPIGTRIGHVHVHVSDLHQSMRFYRDGLGFGGLFIIEAFGMGDVRLDYMPHVLAFNIWSGPTATQALAGAAGLRWLTIVLPDAATLDGVRKRLGALEVSVAEIENGIAAKDPSGNLLHIVV